MRILAIIALTALTALASGAVVTAGGDKTSDLARMQGSWHVATLVENGKAVPQDVTKALAIVIKGDRMTINNDGKPESDYTFKIDPNQKPSTIDMIITDGMDKGKVAPGIYVLGADTLEICVDEELKSRPASFAEKDTKTCSVITLKRKKQ
jgi:uncharacterized protein (TIGR03067 family)